MPSKNQILVKNKKYEGKFVAFRSFTDRTVIAFGKNPSEVLSKAHKKGLKEPVVVFITKDNTSYIY